MRWWQISDKGTFYEQIPLTAHSQLAVGSIVSLHGERGMGTVLKKRRSAKASKRQMAPKRQSVSKRQSFKAPHAKKFGAPALDLVDVQIPCGAVACRSVKASQSVKACQSAKACQSVKAPKRVKASKRLKAPKRPKPPQQVLVKHKFWYTPCLLCTRAISSMTMDHHVLDLNATMSRAYHVSRNLIWIGAAAWPTCVWLWPRVVLQEYQHDKHGMLSFW